MYTILNITCKPNQDTTDQVVYTYVTCMLTCIYTAMGIYIHHVQAYLHLHRRASYQDLPVHMHPRMKAACYTSMYEADRPHVFVRGPTPPSSDYVHPTPTLD